MDLPLGSLTSPAWVAGQVCSIRHEGIHTEWALNSMRQLLITPKMQVSLLYNKDILPKFF